MPVEVEAPDQSMTHVVESLMTPRGMSRDWRILDFGCGHGRHTREFRRAGWKAVGVDQPYPGLAEELAALPDGGEGIYLSGEDGTLPFADHSFDLCFSTSVFEHVMDYDAAIKEISRVVRPGGWSVHFFPARWRLIESHIYVPLGARFQSRAWYRVWAEIGIRNQYQQGMTARETAANNADYARTGLAYPTRRQIRHAFARHFEHFEFVEREFIEATKQVSRVSRAVHKVIGVPGAAAAYGRFHTRAVLTRHGP